jgi:hypothetical protein
MRKALFCIALTGSSCIGAQPLLQASTALDYDDNWNYASRSSEKEADTAASAQAALGWNFVLPDDGTLSLAATAKTQHFERFEELDHTDGGMLATYSRKLGLGGEVPRIWLSTAASRARYRSDVRTGWSYEATAGVDKWFGERWRLQATCAYFGRDAPRCSTRKHGRWALVQPGCSATPPP